MKATYSFLQHHIDTIFNFAPNADTYAKTLKKFLESNGWTEEEYTQRLMQQEQLN